MTKINLNYRRNAAMVSALFAIVLTLSIVPNSIGTVFGQAQFSIEFDTDRMYGDYKDFDLAEANYLVCQNACANDPNCKAFTYVKPGVQATSARCWLKNSIPGSYSNTNCITGIKKGAGGGESVTNFGGPWQAYAWESIMLKQNGKYVTGTYSGGGGGTISGTVQGDKLVFSWAAKDGTTVGEAVMSPITGPRYALNYCTGRGCNTSGQGYVEAVKQ